METDVCVFAGPARSCGYEIDKLPAMPKETYADSVGSNVLVCIRYGLNAVGSMKPYSKSFPGSLELRRFGKPGNACSIDLCGFRELNPS
jgi:hypothetical protein